MNCLNTNNDHIEFSQRDSVVLEWCVTLIPAFPQSFIDVNSAAMEDAISELRATKLSDSITAPNRCLSTLIDMARGGKAGFHERIQ